MKKLFRGLLLFVASIFMFMGVAFCASTFGIKENYNALAEDTNLGVVRIDKVDAFKIDTLQFYYYGAFVEFSEGAFEFEEIDFDAKITIHESNDLDMVHGCEHYEVDGENVCYYLTKAELVAGMGVAVDGYEFPNAIPADKNTPVTFTVVGTNLEDKIFDTYYFYRIRYSAVTSIGTNYTIFTPTIDLEGNASVGGTYEPASGLYKSSVNGRTFKANFDNLDGGKLTFVVSEADNIVLKLDSSNKAFPVYVNGEEVVDNNGDYLGDVDVDGVTASVPVHVADFNLASFVFIPDTGKLIKEVSLSVGNGQQMFTVYGGVYDEPTGATPAYYFPAGVDTTDAIKGSCGNYGFALVNHDARYSYRFSPVSETLTNYAEFVVYDPAGGEPSPEKNQYTIRIYEDGRIKLITSSAVAGVSLEIEAQSFAKIEMRHTKRAEAPDGEDLNDASSDGLNSLVVNIGADEYARYEGSIPNTLFILDYEGVITVTATLKEHNNYFNMELDKIDGVTFVDTIGVNGGVLKINTINEETTFFRIELINPDGSRYSDIYTEIYIAYHTDASTLYSSIEELKEKVAPSQFATTSGEASVEGLYREYYVQYVIVISPYRTITDAALNETVLVYSDLEVSPEERVGNITLGFMVENFEVVKPVFHEGEKLGDIKITLISYSQIKEGKNWIENAIYEVLFKQNGAHNFTTITPSNPYLRGYDFTNMKLAGDEDGFLIKFVDAGDGYFGIDATASEVHRLLSSRLYFAVEETPEEGDVFVEPVFTAQLIEFQFSFKGDQYYGKAYYDDNKLYLDKVFDAKEAGKYFAGLKYTLSNSEVGWVKILEVDYPEFVEEGEFAGMFMYELDSTTPWNSHEPDALYEAQIDLRTFVITVITTNADGTINIIEQEMLFGADFVIDDFAGLITPVYPEHGVYNHIGWIEEMDTDQNYVIKDELVGFINIKTAHNYNWEYDVRIVPVFSANVVSVRFYDEDELLKTVNVKSNQAIKVEDFFVDPDSGEFYAPYRFGYKFIGFAREGVLALKLEFDGTNNYYVPILADNEDIFKYIEPDYLWIASANIDFYASYEEVGYQLVMEVEGYQYSYYEDYTVKISGVDGLFYKDADGLLTLGGFTITDQLYMTGFKPNNDDAYIAYIQLGYRVGTDIIYEEYDFVTTCDANGVLTSVNNGTRFDDVYYTITFDVNELINADTGANAIYMRVVYKPVTFMVSFTANIIKGLDDIIFNDNAGTVFYKFTRENAKISKVDNWIYCDENGVELGSVGWDDLILPTTRLVFMKNSLEGIAGIYYTDRNVTYSFKAWVDFENSIILDGDTLLTQNYNFHSIFSDEFDVTVNYHIYNDYTGYYNLDSREGYFWQYIDEDYTLGDIVTANTFEIYLIGGKLYYISHWTQNYTYGLVVEALEGDLGVREEYVIEYSPDSIVINFYAVYTEYNFSVDKEGNTYSGLVSVPNDANGNSYSSSDVIFLLVNKTLYDSFTGLDHRPVDRLNSQFNTQEKIDNATVYSLIGGIATVDTADLEGNYLFAVVQRKVDGVNIPSFYLALMITL